MKPLLRRAQGLRKEIPGKSFIVLERRSVAAGPLPRARSRSLRRCGVDRSAWSNVHGRRQRLRQRLPSSRTSPRIQSSPFELASERRGFSDRADAPPSRGCGDDCASERRCSAGPSLCRCAGPPSSSALGPSGRHLHDERGHFRGRVPSAGQRFRVCLGGRALREHARDPGSGTPRTSATDSSGPAPFGGSLGDREGRPSLAPYFTHTVLIFTNSRIPTSDSSRP